MPVDFFSFQRDIKYTVAAKPKLCALTTELVCRQTQILLLGNYLKKKKSLKIIFLKKLKQSLVMAQSFNVETGQALPC